MPPTKNIQINKSFLMVRSDGPRITFCNENVAGVLGHALSLLADKNVNMTDMLNKSRDDIACNIIDVERAFSSAISRYL